MQQRRAVDELRDITTVVGPGARFVGTLTGTGNYAIGGSIEGDCDVDGSVLLQEQGEWKGALGARVVVVAGTVEGKITAGDKLELTRSARIRGDVQAPVIAIAEGAVLDGKITMGSAAVTHYQEKRGDHPPQTRIETT